MKTLKERAYNYAPECKYDSDVTMPDYEVADIRREAFIAGAESEHKELTRWNSPECLPKDRGPVLLKMTNAVNGLIRYAVASYIAGRFLCPEMLPKNEILGWREIHE